MNCFIPACFITKCSSWDSVYCVIKISFFFFLLVAPVPCYTNSAFSRQSDCLLALLILFKLTLLDVNHKSWKNSIITETLLFISPSIHKYSLSFHLKPAGKFILRFLPSLAVSLFTAAPLLGENGWAVLHRCYGCRMTWRSEAKNRCLNKFLSKYNYLGSRETNGGRGRTRCVTLKYAIIITKKYWITKWRTNEVLLHFSWLWFQMNPETQFLIIVLKAETRRAAQKKILLNAFSQISLFKYDRLSFPKKSSQDASSFSVNKTL